jgi:hypothetical protein
VQELMKLVARLKRSGLNRVGMALNFICRRIQPCKERVTPGYEYAGSVDTTQEAPEHIDKGTATPARSSSSGRTQCYPTWGNRRHSAWLTHGQR